MRFRPNAIAASTALLGMTLALPSFAMAAINGRSARSAGPIYAQAGATNPGSVDDAILRRTAAAYVKVSDIAIKARQAIDSTDDTARKQQLAAESESAKVAAVKAEGMEPQQYNNVIQMVKADSSLQQKFLSYVQELRHAS
ncbi:MAG TPA: DUF4168 domain-containing protein [Candidatus Binataceae bacterium]|nr:DUF4168 domain-containing protein [Candidatus Binataceae bacterium]